MRVELHRVGVRGGKAGLAIAFKLIETSGNWLRTINPPQMLEAVAQKIRLEERSRCRVLTTDLVNCEEPSTA